MKSGEQGFLVRPRAEEELAARIVEVLGAPDRRPGWARPGAKRAASMTIEQTIDSYADLYRRTIDGLH